MWNPFKYFKWMASVHLPHNKNKNLRHAQGYRIVRFFAHHRTHLRSLSGCVCGGYFFFFIIIFFFFRPSLCAFIVPVWMPVLCDVRCAANTSLRLSTGLVDKWKSVRVVTTHEFQKTIRMYQHRIRQTKTHRTLNWARSYSSKISL